MNLLTVLFYGFFTLAAWPYREGYVPAREGIEAQKPASQKTLQNEKSLSWKMHLLDEWHHRIQHFQMEAGRVVIRAEVTPHHPDWKELRKKYRDLRRDIRNIERACVLASPPLDADERAVYVEMKTTQFRLEHAWAYFRAKVEKRE